ncbi:MAG: RagB/SusD family nutrient uptake outer membrane protein [Bacteroidota bacterium]
MKRILLILTLTTLFATSCSDFLDKPPLSTLTDDGFWVSESNVRLYAQNCYTDYFTGYGSGWTWGKFFSGETFNDDFTTLGAWTKTTPATSSAWTFTYVRKVNILTDRLERVQMSDAAKNHWRGIARMFRALEYSDMAQKFGDVPWYDTPLDIADNAALYKKRDPLATIVQKIIDDFEFAAANVRLTDGALQVNRATVLGLMADRLLYFGTYLKYNLNNTALAKTCLERSKWAAGQIIDGVVGNYSIENNYRAIFSSKDLTSNKEVIFFRQYETAMTTHCLMSYVNREPQTGMSKAAFESYLSIDGLPIKQSPLYSYASDNGKRRFKVAYQNRDPRLNYTVVDSLRINGIHSAYSTSGICIWKFLDATANPGDLTSLSNVNVTDAPIMRLGEVMVNYIEAAVELGTVGGLAVTQADFDKTINKLRTRTFNGKRLPNVTLAGNSLSVNGIIIDDPDRDPSVSPLLWEVRRERRIECMMEGKRNTDLRRWKKYDYLKADKSNVNTFQNPNDLCLGAWVAKADYPASTKWATITTKLWDPAAPKNPTANYVPPIVGGYIFGIWSITSAQNRDWISGDPFYERQYLNPVPLGQIKLYQDQGIELTQNPGW